MYNYSTIYSTEAGYSKFLFLAIFKVLLTIRGFFLLKGGHKLSVTLAKY
jgi:hypothetical protein